MCVVGVALRGKGAMRDQMDKVLTSLSLGTEDRATKEATASKLSWK